MGTGSSLRFHLLVRKNQEVIRRFPLEYGRHVLGRGRNVEMRVAHSSLSREHIAIHVEPGGIELEDLRSLNKTFINGEKLTARTPWNPSDIATAGELELQLVLQEQVAQEHPAETYLVLLNTAEKGTVFQRQTSRIVLGRSRSCDIRVEDATVSRTHARIEYLSPSEGWRLEDLKSANGSYLDGTRVSQGVLRGGETIRIGDVQLLFAGEIPPVSSKRVWLLGLLMALLGSAIGFLLFNLLTSL